MGSKFTALLDTGSSITSMDVATVRQLCLREAQAPALNITFADGRSTSSSSTQVQCPIAIGPSTALTTLRVVPSQAYPIILGWDWITQNRMSINPSHGTLDFVDVPPPSSAAQVTPTDTPDAITEIVSSFSHVFAEDPKSPSRTSIEHRIDTGDALPIRMAEYRRSPKEKAWLEKDLKQMLSAGIIVKSKSAWASPVVVVSKPDGGRRVCIDYRRVNEVTKKDAYALPRVDDALDAFGKATVFTTLDLAAGYYQIRMHPRDAEKTAFRTHLGLFEFRVMPFGLTNAPATFQRNMDAIFEDFYRNFCLVYVDDIIIYSTSLAKHLQHLRMVFERLAQHGLSLKASKCVFAQPAVRFLGFVVSSKGVDSDEEKVKAVQEFPIPTNRRQVLSFLGLCGFYQRFIPNFSDTAAPLRQASLVSASFPLGQAALASFRSLQSSLCSPPTLAFPNFDQPFHLHTDASDVGLGAALAQLHDGHARPVAYASRTLSAAESNYTVTEKECLAVVWALRKYHCYLHGSTTLLFTDHEALRWLNTKDQPKGRVARWIMELQEYDLTIHHRKGAANQDADALSRTPATAAAQLSNDPPSYRPIDLPTIDSIQQAQASDTFCQDLVRLLTTDIDRLHKHDQHRRSRFWLSHQILWHRRKDHPSQVVVPETMRRSLLAALHDHPSAGHMGFKRTMEKVRHTFWWPGLYHDVYQYTRSCDLCQKGKPANRHPFGLLQPIAVNRPFELIGMDCLGPFPVSKSGNRHIVVATDYLTRWAEAIAVPDISAETIATLLLRDIIPRHGIPERLLTDQGRNFTSEIMQVTLHRLGINRSTTSPYHPETDGLTERLNRTLSVMISMYVSDRHDDWDEHIPMLLWAYRTSQQESTRISPFETLYGYRPPQLPEHGLPSASTTPSATAWLAKIEDDLPAIRTKAKSRLVRAQLRQRKQYNSRHKPPTFRINDLVLVWFPIRLVQKAEKLLHRMVGPWRVTGFVTPVTLSLECLPINTNSSGRAQHRPRLTKSNIHVSRITPYHARDDPSFATSGGRVM
jgi:hypothetical protein